MGFRRDGKKAHDDQLTWDEWTRINADLLPACGLPPGVLRSRRDWEYLLRYGYWCEDSYGSHIAGSTLNLRSSTPFKTTPFVSFSNVL